MESLMFLIILIFFGYFSTAYRNYILSKDKEELKKFKKRAILLPILTFICLVTICIIYKNFNILNLLIILSFINLIIVINFAISYFMPELFVDKKEWAKFKKSVKLRLILGLISLLIIGILSRIHEFKLNSDKREKFKMEYSDVEDLLTPVVRELPTKYSDVEDLIKELEQEKEEPQK